jgi:serine phosphatase RsbU (regulator of sigma subunit)
VHGYRRIVFVRGPEANEEAQGRYAAYRHVLEERGIPFDPALVAPGDFRAEAGAEAISTMLDERHVRFDAVVAANDHMALGAMQALQARQIRVPEKVAVIGFDDVEEARFATPPLTTVRQPLYLQGQRALRLVVAALDGARTAGQVEMKTDLVIRKSCGCSSERVQFAQRELDWPIGEGIEAWVGTHREVVIGAMSHAVRSAGSADVIGWEGRLLDAFLGDVLRRTHGRFAAALDEVLHREVAAGADVGAWHAVITTMRRVLVPALLGDRERWVHAEDLWQAGRVLIGDIGERAQAQQRLHVHRWVRTLAETSQALLASEHLSSLTRTIAEQLPRFGIEGCFVSLYEGTARPPRSARLILTYDAARGGVAREPDGRSFPIHHLIPKGAWPRDRRWTFIVEPLSLEHEQFGVALFEMGPREGIIYESLREQVSSALKGLRLVDEAARESTGRHIAERRRQDHEIELAAQIRSSVLPHDLNVEGLGIAAAMLPASEVSGDYYDVVPVENGCWMAIGDVAGRGLRTGLVMLMIQSGLGTLGRQNPHLRPSQLLPFLNDVVFDKVRRRLSDDEQATITLLRCHRDGTIAFAGGDQDMIVCRRRTGACELVPTAGPLLGAHPNIAAATVDGTLRLEDGDLLVLYTDGMIEATNAAGERYGVERLCAEIRRARDEPVTAIRDRVLDGVKGWMARQDDDMTLLVARYRG